MPSSSNEDRNTVVQTTKKWLKEQTFFGGLDVAGGDLKVGGSKVVTEVVATGSVTLSSGAATVDTGVSTSNTATFVPAIAPDTDNADVAAEIRSDGTSGNYEVDIVETADTSVGNPTVNYDILRVR